MNPNIIFLLIDGFRADRCYGKQKTAYTPNIDKLIESGTYFTQVISPADGTTLSLNGIFNGVYPFRTGTRQKKMFLEETNFLNKIKNLNYNTYSIMPKFTSLSPLSENSENDDTWYNPGPPTESISGELGERIIRMISDRKMEQAWFYYIHIFDLHSPLRVPNNFDHEKFGMNKYDKIISSIDAWIGKLLDKIDIKNTLFILTADHGTHLPVDDKDVTSFEPQFESTIKTGKKLIPKSIQPAGAKAIIGMKKAIRNIRLINANKNLTPYEKRSRLPYFTLSLFDESIHVPLLISGFKVPKKIVKQQVSSIDIFPTVFDILKFEYDNSTIHGKSLVPLLRDEMIRELPVYINSMPYEKESSQDIVGIRTSSYKYFRFARDPKKLVNLYNLDIDPYENNNISLSHPEIVSKMEDILTKLTSEPESESISHDSDEDDEIDEEELKEIQEELKKHGYI